MAMHRAVSSRWLSAALRTAERPGPALELPVFLCPTLASHYSRPRLLRTQAPSTPSPWSTVSRSLHMQADKSTTTRAASDDVDGVARPVRKLPAQCTGCGALSQAAYPDQPGYFDLRRKAVRKYLGLDQTSAERRQDDERLEEDVYRKTLESVDPVTLEGLGVNMEDVAGSLALEPAPPRPEKPLKKPLCDRCHLLLHHQTGVSIYHPTVDSIRDTLTESPYKYNHVYHVLDAADFPMSLLPKIHFLLDLMPLRSKNRRSQAGKFYHGQKTEMSFVITRSDLLAPTKPQVDNLVPYLREVLRDALGRTGSNLRLGNIRCVSAKRSWWTKELKEEIWKRGGAGWMVGKVNVGKSQLFEAVFPKGRMDWAPSDHQIRVDMYAKQGQSPGEPEPKLGELKAQLEKMKDAEEMREANEDPDDVLIEKLEVEDVDEFSLLPPAPPETQYPDMPLVSDLPGTTASPIRVPFGNGRGELIDLPGLERTGLEKYVQPEHQTSLVLQSRVVPEQLVLKPGQSLVLGGGLIRLTPRAPAPVVLSYAFTPLEPHQTSTDKAIALQAQTSAVNIASIAAPEAAAATGHAGAFPLRWDVTRERAGPITRRDAVGMHVDRLPYRVLAADILIEGVGWVEVAAQVRTKDLYSPRPREPEEEAQPEEEEPEQKLSALERLEAIAGAEADAKLGRKPQPRRDREQPAQRSEDQARGRSQEKPKEEELNWPIIDVYSPEGKFIGVRRPMNGWLLNKPRAVPAGQRPRRSMKGAKKAEKMRRREVEAADGSRGGRGY